MRTLDQEDINWTLEEMGKETYEVNRLSEVQRMNREDKDNAKIDSAEYERRDLELEEQKEPYRNRYDKIAAEFRELLNELELLCDEVVIAAAWNWQKIARRISPAHLDGIEIVRSEFIDAARAELAETRTSGHDQ